MYQHEAGKEKLKEHAKRPSQNSTDIGKNGTTVP